MRDEEEEKKERKGRRGHVLRKRDDTRKFIHKQTWTAFMRKGNARLGNRGKFRNRKIEVLFERSRFDGIGWIHRYILLVSQTDARLMRLSQRNKCWDWNNSAPVIILHNFDLQFFHSLTYTAPVYLFLLKGLSLLCSVNDGQAGIARLINRDN